MNNFNQQSYFAPINNVRATNNIIWVQGIEGAKAWQLAPNSMAIFLDSENEGKMYIKVTDNIGIGSLRVFNYVEELVQPAQGNATINSSLDLSQYVKKDELSTLIKEIMTNEQSIPTVDEPKSTKPGVITFKKQ
jgi:hypothetical protein